MFMTLDFKENTQHVLQNLNFILRPKTFSVFFLHYLNKILKVTHSTNNKIHN